MAAENNVSELQEEIKTVHSHERRSCDSLGVSIIKGKITRLCPSSLLSTQRYYQHQVNALDAYDVEEGGR